MRKVSVGQVWQFEDYILEVHHFGEGAAQFYYPIATNRDESLVMGIESSTGKPNFPWILVYDPEDEDA